MNFKICLFLVFMLICTEIVADIQTYYLDTELCNQKISMSNYSEVDLHTFRLVLSAQHYYPHNLQCGLQIEAQQDSENMMFYFKHFDVRPAIQPAGCNYDWLELHDGNSTNSEYVCGIDAKLCGISPSRRTNGVFFTRSNYLTLYFQSDKQEKYTGFDMVITRFRYGQCRSDEYACTNGRCIDVSIRCNGYNPCGDDSDCPKLHRGYITAIIVGVLFIISFVANIGLVYKLRKRKKVTPDEKTPLTRNDTESDRPALMKNAINKRTNTPSHSRQPSESTDPSSFQNLLPPSGTLLSNSGYQAAATGRRQGSPDSGILFTHSSRNEETTEPKTRYMPETEVRVSTDMRSNDEESTDVKQFWSDNTKRRQMCEKRTLTGDFNEKMGFDSGFNTQPKQFGTDENTFRKQLESGESTQVKQCYSAPVDRKNQQETDGDCDVTMVNNTSIN